MTQIIPSDGPNDWCAIRRKGFEHPCTRILIDRDISLKDLSDRMDRRGIKDYSYSKAWTTGISHDTPVNNYFEVSENVHCLRCHQNINRSDFLKHIDKDCPERDKEPSFENCAYWKKIGGYGPHKK